MLEIINVTKRYGEICAVDQVSFCVKDFERVSIQGESGCGKSTLLGMIAGLIGEDAGEIRLNGEKMPEDPHLRRVSMVFQDSVLWDHMTLRENILFGSPYQEKKQREEQAEKLAEALEIKDLLKRHPHQVSGGQARRAAIARAIACEKELLLLDEPFSNLDKEGRVRTLETVKRLCDGKCAILLVTHSAKEAELLCERHLFMEEGKLKA